MKKVIPFAIVFLIIIAICVADSPATTVYITKSGKAYHRESCTTLKKSKIQITLGEAVERGFVPCKICRPPALDSENGK
jgi:hypothetical protein